MNDGFKVDREKAIADYFEFIKAMTTPWAKEREKMTTPTEREERLFIALKAWVLIKEHKLSQLHEDWYTVEKTVEYYLKLLSRNPSRE